MAPRKHPQRFGLWPWLLLAGLLFSLAWGYWQCLDTEVVGFIQDDGVYTILAKNFAQSLAAGRGLGQLTLEHLVTQPFQLRYPILYPLMLSLGGWEMSSFPGNLLLLKSITASFSLAGLALLFCYLGKVYHLPRWLALLLVLTVGSQYFFVFYTTSLMAEAPYFFLSLLTLFIAERFLAPTAKPAATQKSQPWHWLCVVIVLSILTFHTRMLGVTLISALFLWLLLHRQWLQAGIYLSVSLPCTLLAWWTWTATHPSPPITPLTYPLLNPYSQYSLNFAIHSGSLEEYWEQLPNTTGQLIHTLAEYLIPMLINLPKFLPPWVIETVNGFAWTHLIVGSLLTLMITGYYLLFGVRCLFVAISKQQWPTASGLYLFFYLALCVTWNFENQIARFLVPVLPWLWLAVLTPIRRWLATGRVRLKAVGLTAAMLVLTVLPNIVGWQSLGTVRQNHWLDFGEYPGLWSDYRATFAYIRKHLPPKAPIAAEFDTVFYLYTEHPMINLNTAAVPVQLTQNRTSAYQALMKSLMHYGIRYVALEPQLVGHRVAFGGNMVTQALLKQFPKKFQPVYIAPQGHVMLYEIVR